MLARHTWTLYALTLAVLTGIFFADLPTLGLDTHDAETFRDHDRIAADFAHFFSPDKEQASGRPTAELLKYLYYRLVGNSAPAFHLLAIALHVACSWLVARVAHRLGTPLMPSLTGGLLFLTNIAHFQVVHYISALDYALALGLGLGALLAYARHMDKPSPTALSLCYSLLLAAVFAHLSMIIVLPFCLYLSVQRGTTLSDTLRQLAPLGLLLGLAFLLQLALASRETSTWNSLAGSATVDPLALVHSWLRVSLWLASRLLTTAHWLPLPVYTLQTWELLLGALVLCGLGVGFYRQQLWASWTLLALVPFVFLTEATLLDMPVGPSRYLYPASVGASLLVAQGLSRLHRYLSIGLVGALLLSSYLTGDATEALSRYTSGRSYIANKQLPEGIDQLRRAIDLAPDAIDLEDAHTRLIVVALDSAQIAPAVLQLARTHYPDNAQFALAEQVRRSMTADTQAPAALDQHTAHAPWIGRLYANMGDGHFARGDWANAIRAREYALRYDPGRTQTRLLLAWTYFMTNRFEDAIAAYRDVLDQGPDAEAHFSMGLAHIALGDTETATSLYAEGIARYGRREAEAVKARENLDRLIALGIQPNAARMLIHRHFPD